MSKHALWIVVNRETGLIEERFGRHGSEDAGKLIIEE